MNVNDIDYLFGIQEKIRKIMAPLSEDESGRRIYEDGKLRMILAPTGEIKVYRSSSLDLLFRVDLENHSSTDSVGVTILRIGHDDWLKDLDELVESLG